MKFNNFFIHQHSFTNRQNIDFTGLESVLHISTAITITIIINNTYFYLL